MAAATCSRTHMCACATCMFVLRLSSLLLLHTDATQPHVHEEVLQLAKERPDLMVFPCGRPCV